MAAIIRADQQIKSPLFVVKHRGNTFEHNRYAVVLSKKLEKSAVKRNKKRRQVYEIIRLFEKNAMVPNETSSDIIFLARTPVMTASFDDLNHAVTELLTKLHE